MHCWRSASEARESVLQTVEQERAQAEESRAAEERYLVMEAISRLRQGILDQPVDLWCVAGAARRLRPAALTAGAAFAQGLASRQPPAPD